MNRQEISRAITKVLNAAEAVGVSYTDALGFFAAPDYELITDGTLQPHQLEHALKYGVDLPVA